MPSIHGVMGSMTKAVLEADHGPKSDRHKIQGHRQLSSPTDRQPRYQRRTLPSPAQHSSSACFDEIDTPGRHGHSTQRTLVPIRLGCPRQRAKPSCIQSANQRGRRVLERYLGSVLHGSFVICTVEASCNSPRKTHDGKGATHQGASHILCIRSRERASFTLFHCCRPRLPRIRQI